MRQRLRKLPSPAMVLAASALLVALGGTSIAAVSQVPRASVGAPQLKANAVTGAKIANNTITSVDVRNRSLRRIDFGEGQLPAGPVGAQGPQGQTGPPGPASGAAGGALAGNYPNPTLAAAGRGPAVAGVRWRPDGTVMSWFNRRGGAPTVDQLGGLYEIHFPGSSFNVDENVVAVATLVGQFGDILIESEQGDLVVQTQNDQNVEGAASAMLVVYDSSGNG